MAMGVLGIVLVNLLVGDLKETARRPLDRSGFVLTGIGLATVAVGCENVGRGTLPSAGVIGLLAVGVICLTLYVRHARRVSHPIIDLALFSIPTYASASIGGFLFRMGLGALPFLLPLMVQVGVGRSALNSGLLTFASAAGAMLMKTTAVRILRALGFRIVLVGDAVISAAFLFGYSLFRPDTPHLVIFLALLIGGFFRSLQMTSINTLSYADVPPSMLSRATSLSSMAQQLSQTADIERTCEFYTRVLGMEVVRFGEGRTALRFGQQKINLHAANDIPGLVADRPTPGSADLCFITLVPLAEVTAHLEACGVPVVAGPGPRAGAIGTIQSVYIRDPDLNLVESSNY